MQTRRDFMIQFGVGSLGLAALPLLKACANVTTLPTDPRLLILGADRLEILRLAALAPSSHNSQPWQIKIVTPDHWQLLADLNRRLPAVDPANREGLLSIGAFLANLKLAAPHFGWWPEIKIVAENTTASVIADCFLSKITPQTAILQNLTHRRTVRTGFVDRELAREDLAALRSLSPDQVHYFPLRGTASEFPAGEFLAGEFLAKATIEANQTQVRREDAQSELAEWIRWSNADAEKLRDGLTPATMEITGLAGYFVRYFYNRDSVLSEGFRKKSIELVTNQVQAGAGWLVITSPDSSVPALLGSGEIYQKICLDAGARKIAIHPMSQILEEAPWKTKVAAELGLNGCVQFILRVGYVEKYPAPVSLRRPVEWFVS